MDDSQAVSLVSALVVPLSPPLSSQQCYDMKKTIAQKASCHGYRQRDGSGVYDANKRACNYRIQQAQKITRGANSAAIRQLHKLVFPLTERNWSFDSGDNSRKKIIIMRNKSWDSHQKFPYHKHRSAMQTASR